MAVAGLALILRGVVIAAPRSAVLGSVARRQVRMGAIAIYTTPGYQERLSTRLPRQQIVVGLLMTVTGVALLIFGL